MFPHSGIGEGTSTPTSTVDNLLLFVDAFQLVLSVQMTGGGEDGDPGTPASCRDRIRQFQNELRSLAETLGVHVVVARLHTHLTRGNYVDQFDTDTSEAFEKYFQQLLRDLDTPENRTRVTHRTAPPPLEEQVFMPATRFPGTRPPPPTGQPGLPPATVTYACGRQCTSVRRPHHRGRRIKHVPDRGRYPPDLLDLVPPAPTCFYDPSNSFRASTDRMCRFLSWHSLYTGPVRPGSFHRAPGPRPRCSK